MILYSNIPTVVDNGELKVTVNDTISQELLNELVSEMKKMNIQMTLITDHELEDEEEDL